MLNDKKIPLIPFLFPNNNFIYKILKKKNELFNEHFSKQCSLTQNRSTITSVFLYTSNSQITFAIDAK